MISNDSYFAVTQPSFLPDRPYELSTRAGRAVKPFAWLAAIVVAGVLVGCGSPTQVVQDPDAFKAVDALWTAVGAQRVDLIEQVDKQLDQLAVAGKLPAEGRKELKMISDTARKGQWESAARTLKWFIQGQRRAK